MAFSPFIKNSTQVVDVTSTVSQDVVTPSILNSFGNPLYPSEVVIFNAGPSIAFFDRAASGESTNANVGNCPPLPVGSTQAIAVDKDMKLAFISEGTSKVYVTFGGGDQQGFSSLAAVP